MKRSILTLAIVLLIGSITFFSSCSDTGTGGGVVIDQNVRIFEGLVVSQFNTGASLSGVNLLTGEVLRADDGAKDIHLADSNSIGVNFFFRSGTLGLDEHGNVVVDGSLAGMETLFGATITYLDITKSQFDTITRIPVSGSGPLDTTHFLNNQTSNYQPPYFTAPLQYNTVYSFWLKGKSHSQVNQGNIFGILYLRSAQNVLGQFQVTIDVKVNTAGQNTFRREIIS
jgi:hypothetical protein